MNLRTVLRIRIRPSRKKTRIKIRIHLREKSDPGSETPAPYISLSQSNIDVVYTEPVVTVCVHVSPAAA